MTDAFDWTEQDNVTVRTQMAIAVYLNPFGELVIRQEGQFHPDEDHWVVIAPDNVPKVLVAIQEAIGVTAAGTVTKDPKAANRQHRRHDGHRDDRNGVTPIEATDAVTDCDAGAESDGRLPLLAAE